jgi:adenosylcobinamide-phosphate synthase
MGAMALALGVRLGKPGVYLLNADARAATAADVDGALRRAAWALWPAIVLLLALAFALRTGS